MTREERFEASLKVLALAAVPVLVFTELFKFAPDLATESVQAKTSPLSSYAGYREVLVGVHAARFAGNELVFRLAKGIEATFHLPADPRMHPLRLAAAVVASFAAAIPLATLMCMDRSRWSWPAFAAAWGPLAFLSLQIYKPYDLTSMCFIMLALVALIADRFVVAAALLAAGGLFRESVMHIAWFALVFAYLRGGTRRWILAIATGVLWAVELAIIRNAYGVQSELHFAFLTKDLSSPSLWLSVIAALLFAGIAAIDLARRDRKQLPADDQALFRFFALQIAVLPLWFWFYRVTGGGLAEFRMLLPALGPIALGLAWRPAASSGAHA